MGKPVLYNEIDKHAAAWLRELIRRGLIADGDVDERSITELGASDLEGRTQVHLFAGIGGWSLALRLAGWPDDRPVWTGSCPCQPYSSAGLQRRGRNDDRHLWPEEYRLVRISLPPVVFGEQVPRAIRHGWLDGVACDLEEIGYSFGSGVLSASAANAPHRRDRIWFVADSEWNKQSRKEPRIGPDRRVGRVEQLLSWDAGWTTALSRFRALDNGIPRCVEGTDAARNAIVPQVAAEFIRAYMEIA